MQRLATGQMMSHASSGFRESRQMLFCSVRLSFATMPAPRDRDLAHGLTSVRALGRARSLSRNLAHARASDLPLDRTRTCNLYGMLFLLLECITGNFPAYEGILVIKEC